MGIKQVEEASLEGYEGPIFPEEIKELNKILRAVVRKHLRQKDIDTLKEIENVERISYAIVTTDRYRWNFALFARMRKSGEVIVVFPRLTSFVLDRSVAVYVKSKASISVQEVNVFLERIQLRFHRAWRRQTRKELQEILDPISKD
ncbi:hypothetical protein KJA15_01315 [Patescibacteria group bacterium]|nr:hypothetical protein [Patescibacteria group bacterium]